MKNVLSKLTFFDWYIIVSKVLQLAKHAIGKQVVGYSALTYDEMVWMAATIPLPVFRNYIIEVMETSENKRYRDAAKYMKKHKFVTTIIFDFFVANLPIILKYLHYKGVNFNEKLAIKEVNKEIFDIKLQTFLNNYSKKDYTRMTPGKPGESAPSLQGIINKVSGSNKVRQVDLDIFFRYFLNNIKNLHSDFCFITADVLVTKMGNNSFVTIKQKSNYMNVTELNMVLSNLKIIDNKPDDHFKNEVNNCSYRYVFIPMSYLDIGHKFMHANMLLYDRKNKTLERFEPQPEGTYYSNTDKVIKDFFSFLGPFKYIPPKSLCYSIQGGAKHGFFEPNMYCSIWSLLFVELKLTFGDEANNVFQYLLDQGGDFRGRFINSYMWTILDNKPELKQKVQPEPEPKTRLRLPTFKLRRDLQREIRARQGQTRDIDAAMARKLLSGLGGRRDAKIVGPGIKSNFITNFK